MGKLPLILLVLFLFNRCRAFSELNRLRSLPSVLHVYVSLRQAFHSHPAAATDNYPYWLYLPWLSLSRHSIRVSLARNKRSLRVSHTTHALAGCVFYCTRVDSDDVELPPAKVARVHPAQPHQGRQSSSRHRPGPKSVTSPQNEEEDPRLNRAGASASHQWIQESQGQHVDAAYYHNQQDQRHPVPYHSRHGYQDAVI